MKAFIAINTIGALLVLLRIVDQTVNYYSGRLFQPIWSFNSMMITGAVITILLLPYLAAVIFLVFSSHINKKRKVIGLFLWMLYPSIFLFAISQLPNSVDGMAASIREKAAEYEFERFARDALNNRPENYGQRYELISELNARHPEIRSLSEHPYRLGFGENYVDIYWKTGFDSTICIRVSNGPDLEPPAGFGVHRWRMVTPKIYIYEFSA
jgi:hypothetical protein